MSTLSSPDVLRRTGGQPVKSIVYDEATIAARVAELGAEITEAYPDGELLVLGLLKGSFIFLSDLVRTDRAAAPGGLPGGQLLRRGEGLERRRSGCSTTRRPGWRGNTSSWSRILLTRGKTLQRLMALLGERRPRSLADLRPARQGAGRPRSATKSGSWDFEHRRRSWSAMASITPRTFGISRSSRIWNKMRTIDFRPRPPRTNWGNLSKNLALWLLVALLALALFQMMSRQRNPTQEFTYTEFSRQLDQGNVARVEVFDGKRLEGEFRTPVDAGQPHGQELPGAAARRQQRSLRQAARGRGRADHRQGAQGRASPRSSSRRCRGS